jgi:tRNA U34 5-methylaminomethyl-2-thiouridine-forming methyltransferase MnmC
LELFASSKDISIFELGFGTGLNALLTCLWAEKNKINIHYLGIEAFPISMEICHKLDYPSRLVDYNSSELYNKILKANWNEDLQISTYFTLCKIQGKIEDWESNKKFNLIYFDAFGPRAQPEIWQLPILEKMNFLLKEKGLLVTYCAQGQFRRNLKAINLLVESLPGPPGKREMTRAFKDELT